jgi:hypothetical protein
MIEAYFAHQEDAGHVHSISLLNSDEVYSGPQMACARYYYENSIIIAALTHTAYLSTTPGTLYSSHQSLSMAILTTR